MSFTFPHTEIYVPSYFLVANRSLSSHLISSYLSPATLHPAFHIFFKGTRLTNDRDSRKRRDCFANCSRIFDHSSEFRRIDRFDLETRNAACREESLSGRNRCVERFQIVRAKSNTAIIPDKEGGTDIREDKVCTDTFAGFFLNYSIKFIIHMRVTCVYVVVYPRIHPYVHVQHGRKRSSFVHHRIFISLFSSLPSFVNSILVFFPSSYFLFVYFFFFFLDRSFQPVSISAEISVAMRDSTKESELARVCAKGRAKVFATSRNCFEKSFSSMKSNDR